ncbi:hypothetical protein [uncultured Microbulbifer sp.]|uniref:hypothetical protein n=1 Tax=uncultured Microbulbifer sp. TaxID=348147 RepID=UPI00260CF952|nr:hypothetical protein [uncultured Microbulbifer sp.]
MISEISIRERLWEWARAYPDRTGDFVSWPRIAAFARRMKPTYEQYPEPIDYDRSALTDAAVLVYLNVIARRQDKKKAALERSVFWLRYYHQWEMQHVARKVNKSKPWVEKMCQIIEATVEAFILSQDAA